jgi:hypothetical protein
MNSPVVKLLQAAEFVGGEKQLAVSPRIAQSLLGKLIVATGTSSLSGDSVISQ